MSQTVDDILAGLCSARKTMEKQTVKIGEIMDKSNSTLLHIDTQNTEHGHTTITSPALDDPPQNVYNLNADCEMALVKILNQFHELMQNSLEPNNETAAHSDIDGCVACRQRVEYLGSSVRKLKSVCDTVLKMKISLQEQQQQHEDECEETDDE